MTIVSLSEVARFHCAADTHALNFRGFVRENYGVGHSFFGDVATGKKKPSTRLLIGLASTHTRLFPTEPVLLTLPNHPPVLLGDTSHLSN